MKLGIHCLLLAKIIPENQLSLAFTPGHAGPRNFRDPHKIPAQHRPVPRLGPHISGAPFLFSPGQFPVPGSRFLRGTV